MKLCSPSMGCAFTCWTRTPSFSCRRQGRGIRSIWFNVLVPDIEETFAKALKLVVPKASPSPLYPSSGCPTLPFLIPSAITGCCTRVHREVSFEKGQALEERLLRTRSSVESRNQERRRSPWLITNISPIMLKLEQRVNTVKKLRGAAGDGSR